LTYSTLGAILKYPCSASSSQGKTGPKHRSKYGYFQSDKLVFQDIAAKLGLIADGNQSEAFKRHPFVYLVEAADDICYSIIDFEDAHRLRIFSTEEVKKTLLSLVELNPQEDIGKIKKVLKEVFNNNDLRIVCGVTHKYRSPYPVGPVSPIGPIEPIEPFGPVGPVIPV
jgi:dGTPase